jgi:hypothetical protein
MQQVNCWSYIVHSSNTWEKWEISKVVLSKNLKFKIYSNIILPVFFYGCETWSLILREELRLRVSGKRTLRIFWPKWDEDRGELYVMRSLMMCTAQWSVLITQYCSGDQIEKNETDGACSGYGERRGVYRALVRKYEGKTPLGRTRRRWEYNITMDLQDVRCGTWTGPSWLRIEIGDRHVWLRQWTFVFHKMRGISWLAEDRLASQEGLSLMD